MLSRIITLVVVCSLILAKGHSQSIKRAPDLSCSFELGKECCWTNQIEDNLAKFQTLAYNATGFIQTTPPYLAVHFDTDQKTAVFTSCAIDCQSAPATLSFDAIVSANDVKVFVCVVDGANGFFTSCNQLAVTNTTESVKITIPARTTAFSISIMASVNADDENGTSFFNLDNIKYEAQLCEKKQESSLDVFGSVLPITDHFTKGFRSLTPQLGLPDIMPEFSSLVDIDEIQDEILSRGTLLELTLAQREWNSELANNQSSAFKQWKRNIEGLVEFAMAKTNPIGELMAGGWDGQSFMVAQCKQAFFINVMEFREGSTVGLMSLTPPKGVRNTAQVTNNLKGITNQPNRRLKRQFGFGSISLAPQQPVHKHFINRPSQFASPIVQATNLTRTLVETAYSKSAALLASNYQTPGLERYLQNGDLVSWDIGDLDWFCPQLQGDYKLKCLDKPYNQCDDRFCSAFFANCKRCDDPKVGLKVDRECGKGALPTGFCASHKFICEA